MSYEIEPKLVYYESNEALPAHLFYQIHAYLRIQWHEYDPYQWGKNPPATPDFWHPSYFLVLADDCLLSAAKVVWWNVKHDGNEYKCYGLTGVFTYPAWRKRGYGKQAVEAATKYILASDADLAILWTAPESPFLEQFYAAFGWQHYESVKLRFYVDERSSEDDAFRMMLFVSERVKQIRQAFDEKPIFFGPYPW